MGLSKQDLAPVIEELDDIASLIQAQRGRAATGQVDMQRYHREAQMFYERIRRLAGQIRGLGETQKPPAKKKKGKKAPMPASASYEEWNG